MEGVAPATEAPLVGGTIEVWAAGGTAVTTSTTTGTGSGTGVAGIAGVVPHPTANTNTTSASVTPSKLVLLPDLWKCHNPEPDTR